MSRIGAFATGWVVVVLAPTASAGEAKEATYDQAAVAAALEETPGKVKDKAGSPLDVPPPPPRRKGLVLEASVGAMGFLGKLNTVSPTASHLHLQIGYELFRWLMFFGEGDLCFTSTRYIAPSRGYSMYGVGGGVRFTVPFTARVSAYAQGDVGMMKASSDVLATYGFYDADSLNGYFGATAGIEWYQIDPHYALALNGGVRQTPGFQRAVAGDSAISWLAAAAIRYTF